ncbi:MULTISPECIES: hypothetical protein [unclassified Streptomyces]|uniref:hypothetical protein n=1 Tax=unclassified Streptomyces TaxID=2593676 RepID=UPI00381E41FF
MASRSSEKEAVTGSLAVPAGQPPRPPGAQKPAEPASVGSAGTSAGVTTPPLAARSAFGRSGSTRATSLSVPVAEATSAVRVPAVPVALAPP